MGVAEANKLAKRLGAVDVAVPLLPLRVLVDLPVVAAAKLVGLVGVGGVADGGARGGAAGYCSRFGGSSSSGRNSMYIKKIEYNTIYYTG